MLPTKPSPFAILGLRGVVGLTLTIFLALQAHAQDAVDLSPSQLRDRVEAVNTAQNRVMLRGSTASDVNCLFDLYTEEFTYIHEAYGGTYTRDELYGNTMRYLEAGGYTMDVNRYEILSMIPGRNAVAVERLEDSGNVHLAVFEFDGPKVSRITEYWE